MLDIMLPGLDDHPLCSARQTDQRCVGDEHADQTVDTPQCHRDCDRQQPEQRDEHVGHRHTLVRAVPARRVLIGVAAVGFAEAFAAGDAAHQRHGCVDHEAAAEDEPAPEELGRGVAAPKRERGDHAAEKAAAGVAHEDARRREVPDQEAGDAGGEGDGERPVALRLREPPYECAAERDGDRFETGDAVDTVHEIEEVDGPDEVQGGEQHCADAKIDNDAEEWYRRQRAEPPQDPDGGG